MNNFNPDSFQEGPIIEEERDHWWQEGKTRVKDKVSFLQSTKGKIILVAGVVSLLLAFFFILISLSRTQIETDEPLIQIEETARQSDYTSLQSRIKNLNKQLEKADPVIREVAPPQVEMELFIYSE